MKINSNTLLNEKMIQEVRQDNCFDFLRYLFAFSLIIAHYCTLTGTEQLWIISGTNRVKAFFTITGFLVTYSFLRGNCEIKSYTRKRFFRIIPAYIVCVVFCLLLGFGVSNLKFIDFFTDSQTWKYLASNLLMLNWLEPELPETFQSNSVPVMNGSLWSMKQEVIFYCITPLLIYIITKTKRYISLIIIISCIAAYNFVNNQTQYFMYFISGMTLLLYFDIFIKIMKTALPIAFLLFLMIKFIYIPVVSQICYTIEPITFPVMLVGFAYWCKPLAFFKKYENITYGLYLYHFPVIQTLILYGIVEQYPRLAFAITIAATSILACFSWFLIEKPLIGKYKNVLQKAPTADIV